MKTHLLLSADATYTRCGIPLERVGDKLFDRRRENGSELKGTTGHHGVSCARCRKGISRA